MSEMTQVRLASEGDCLVVRVPLRIRRRRGRREIIAPAGLEDVAPVMVWAAPGMAGDHALRELPQLSALPRDAEGRDSR